MYVRRVLALSYSLCFAIFSAAPLTVTLLAPSLPAQDLHQHPQPSSPAAPQPSSPAAPQPSSGSDSTPYTLGVESRLVIEDVIVTGKDGKPVTGLPQSAFHLTDQGRPQSIRSFEEGGTRPPETTPAGPSLPQGTFTSLAPGDSRTTSEVLLIDADRMELVDQSYLLKQLEHAIDAIPPGVQAAIFRVSNGRPVQIRGMTADRADLKRAVNECLPVVTHQIDSQFQSALEQLLTVAAFLEQTPGRKNVLWFSGQFPLLRVDWMEDQPGSITVDYSTREHIVRQVEEALDEARVTVYPFDVRGVQNYDLAPPSAALNGNAGLDRNPSAVMSRTPVVQGPYAEGPADSREQMRQFAEATGGRAFFENNLDQEITRAFDLGRHAYTLSYVPSPYATDESWHKVKITVDGGYAISYRPGYLATWTGMPSGRRQGVRLEEGEKVAVGGSSNPLQVSRALRFTVAVEPGVAGAHSKGRLPLDLTVNVPSEDAEFVHHGGQWQSDLVVATYLYDTTGKVETGKVQELNTVLSPEKYTAAQGKAVSTRQHLEVPRSAHYLLVAVRDRQNKRAGSVSLPMRAVRALPSPGSTPVAGPASPSQPAPATASP